jgi:regulator of Ty1 transposition protein 103
MFSATPSRKLVFMYLANDVIQNSKKKGPEYSESFSLTLAKAFKDIGKYCNDEKTIRSLDRILSIWEDRGVYDGDKIKEFRVGIAGKVGSSSSSKDSSSSKKRKHDDGSSASTSNGNSSDKKPKPPTPSKAKVVEVNGETHVTLSPHLPVGEPPEPEELIKMLQDLEEAASSDAATREKITRLPPDVSSLESLSKIDDKDSALKLSKKVNEAVDLLKSYNARLADEMNERNKLTVMLKDFQREQQELLTQAEQKLQVRLKLRKCIHEDFTNFIISFQEYTEKLTKVREVQKEIKNHLENLPDIINLPDVTGGLAALPSAADLFQQH